jgi:predicted TIM-barrel fold metal-dependent hydrolase
VVTGDGRISSAGDFASVFTVQSISKVVSLMLAIIDRGEEYVFSKVGMEATGDAFNSIIKLETAKPSKPLNPMINAGAIAIDSLIAGKDQEDKFLRLVGFFRKLCGNESLWYNERIYEKRFKDRLVPFAIINPIYTGWKDDFETCTTKMGMKGLRLFPQYHDYEITEPRLVELVKMARDRGLPVAFDIRMVDSRQRSWMDIPVFEPREEKYDIITKEWQVKNIIPIIKEVPDAKYIIVNLANVRKLSDEDMAVIKKANVVFDTSGREIRGENTLGAMIKTYGIDKFAFGSHSPILDYLSGMLRVESLTDKEADMETRELIRSGNAKRIIGLT